MTVLVELDEHSSFMFKLYLSVTDTNIVRITEAVEMRVITAMMMIITLKCVMSYCVITHTGTSHQCRALAFDMLLKVPD